MSACHSNGPSPSTISPSFTAPCSKRIASRVISTIVGNLYHDRPELRAPRQTVVDQPGGVDHSLDEVALHTAVERAVVILVGAPNDVEAHLVVGVDLRIFE